MANNITFSTLLNKTSFILYKLHLFRDFTFAEQYFTILRLIKNRNSKWLLRYRFAQLLLIYSALHTLVVCFTQPYLSYLINCLLYNLPAMTGLNSHWNLAMTAMSLLCLYLLKLWYKRNIGISAAILYDILILENNDAFLWKYRDSIRNIWSKAMTVRAGSSNNEMLTNAAYIKQIALAIRMCLQSTYLMNGLSYFAVQIPTLAYIYQTTNQTNFWFHIFAAIYLQAAGIICLLIITLAFHLVNLGIIFSVCIMAIGHIMMKQYCQYVGTIGSSVRLYIYLNHAVLGERFLFDVSKLYGTTLFLIIILTVPLMALGIPVLIYSNISILWKVVLCTCAGLDAAVIWGFHFYGAYMGVLIRRPVKAMIAIFVGSLQIGKKEDRKNRLLLGKSIRFLGGGNTKAKGGRGPAFYLSTRTRLHLATHIELVHSDNAPAVSYGRYGKVTYHSFGREIYYFFKFLAFGYKVYKSTTV